jgi:hypothetical protein
MTINKLKKISNEKGEKTRPESIQVSTPNMRLGRNIEVTLPKAN